MSWGDALGQVIYIYKEQERPQHSPLRNAWRHWFSIWRAHSMTTVWSRWDRKDLIHLRVNPSIPIDWSFRRRRWWATSSNAFAKSKRIASVWVLLSRDFMKSLDDSRSCVSHERLFLKPCWASVRMSFLSRCHMTCELMICSITLQHTGR